MTRRFPVACAALVLATGSLPSLAHAAASEGGSASSIDDGRCAQLASLKIRAGLIGLPTRGAEITAARMAGPSGTGTDASPAHCLVSGRIASVDPASPDIEFQIALPASWNGKAVMFGGGGSNGIIPKITGSPLNADGFVTPLGGGYVTFGSDGGHQGQGMAFALNREAHLNWMNDALKKTRDASVMVVKAAYGTPPKRSYFIGSSTGGREALAVAGRWPGDWDGVVSLYPARDVMVSIFGMLAANQTLAAPGAYPDAAQRRILYRAALEACDTLDGLQDGIISDIRTCHTTFRPEAAHLEGKPIRCGASGAQADACITDTQFAALRKLDAPVEFGYTLANGESSFPGFNIFTSDSASPGSAERSFGLKQPASPPAPGMPLSAFMATDFLRHAVTADAQYDGFSFDIGRPGVFAERVQELSAIDMADRDLRGFAARGGKILLLHGTDDLLTSSRITERYYAQLQRDLTPAELNGMVRYFEVPGFGHSYSNIFKLSWDQLSALDAWVEKGVDPAKGQVGVDRAGVPGRTRPLCLYPTWPKYRGRGDPNVAASFVCAAK